MIKFLVNGGYQQIESMEVLKQILHSNNIRQFVLQENQRIMFQYDRQNNNIRDGFTVMVNIRQLYLRIIEKKESFLEINPQENDQILLLSMPLNENINLVPLPEDNVLDIYLYFMFSFWLRFLEWLEGGPANCCRSCWVICLFASIILYIFSSLFRSEEARTEKI